MDTNKYICIIYFSFRKRLERILPADVLIGEDDSIKEMQYIIKKYGLEEAQLKIKQKLDAWKDVPVNVCLLGESGVGKSSFINNIFRKEVARVGIDETTQKQKSYPHPDNEKLVFWDFPGFGGQIYPTIELYIESMDMKRFDIILFFYTSKLKCNDAELLREIKEIGKPFFVLRSKFDIDIQSGNEVDIKDKIQTDLTKILPNEKCYFISNLTRTFDYEKLMNDIFSSLGNSMKKQVLAFSLRNTNKAIISIKKDQLEKRIWVVSTVAAGFGAIPIPGVDFLLNAALLVKEFHFMAKVLGILDDILENRNQHYTKFASYLTASGITTLALKAVAPIAADEAFKVLLPVVGSVISSGIAFAFTKMTLHKFLADIVKAAEMKMEMEMEMESQRCKKGIEMESLDSDTITEMENLGNENGIEIENHGSEIAICFKEGNF